MNPKRFAWIAVGIALLAAGPAARAADERWNGFARVSFTLDGHACFVTQPRIAAPGRPWIWRTSFPDYHPEVDVELLNSGWHVAFIDCVNMLGCDAALDLYDRFYERMTKEQGLSAKPALEAVSRGGLHAYRYAARRPERIACIYADVPVMDLKSWPQAAPELQDALKFYGLKDRDALMAFQGNPVDLLAPIAKAKIPIRHVISLDDRVVPPAQNTLEAQRRFAALGGGMEVVSVAQGTPASDGHQFPVPAAFESARFVMRHSAVLPAGREYFALRGGLNNSRATFEEQKAGRVVFLGGSITHNPGWRDAVMRYLQQRFPQTKFAFVAAGVPSLGSVPHAFRLEHDVLSGGPVDLLFVEAAVNDHNYDSLPNCEELALRGMEGVVRHLRMANPMTDVVEMHFIHNQHFKTYAKGQTPYTVSAHEQVAAQYGCPSLNLSQEVNDRIAANEFTWERDFRDLHPSPYGQQLYANSMTRMLDAAWPSGAPAAASPHPLPDPLDPRSYFRGRYGDIRDARIARGFAIDPKWRPSDGKETRAGFVNVPALVANTAGAEFEFDFEGTAAGLFITSGPDAGIVEYSADGNAWKSVDTATAWSQALHLPWALILDDTLPAGLHKIRIRLPDDRPGSALRVFHLLEN